MKPAAIITIVLITVIGVFAGAALLIRDRLNARELPLYGKAPAFELVDSSGAPFESASLRGKPYVINFFFSHCQAVCPTTNGAMKRLARNLDPHAVRFLSVSVDPERDTPEVLDEYASTFNANPAQWTFLAGPRSTIDRILNELKLGTSDDIAQHTSRLVLVDEHSEIRGYYQGTDEESVQTLAQHLALLLP